MEIISYEILYCKNGTICLVVICGLIRSHSKSIYASKVFRGADYNSGYSFGGQGHLYWILGLQKEVKIEGTFL